MIPQGHYRERIELRQGVTLRAQVPGTVTLTSPDGGPAVVANKIDAGGIEGVWIQGDLEAPLSMGIEINDSSPFISNVKVTDANIGIEVRGASAPSITSSQITNNLGAGILVLAEASPRIEGNLIAANGNGKPGAAKPGVEVLDKAHPVLRNNGIVDNGAEPIWIHGRAYQPADFEENFFGGLPAKQAIRLIGMPNTGAGGQISMDPKLFGRYQIIRKLAGGGMGRVFLAYDPVLNRQVGLKLIDAGGDRDSIDVVAAERRGATLQDQLAKREASGRVAQIFDVGDRDGYFYIAMEYIEGEDLSELVARGPLDPQRAVGIALDVLDVLVKAHTFQTVIEDRTHRGIIHGDIKPRNIRITAAGQVKVLDFGIAKAVSMTRSITFNQFGSVPYSSPERLQTGDMDARSDVWSVAIVLFEMLTGKPYFEAEASSKLEWMIRNYRALQPAIAGLPPGLREILSRALDPDLNKRFASAAAFQAALHEWRNYGLAPARAAALRPILMRRGALFIRIRRSARIGLSENAQPRVPVAARAASAYRNRFFTLPFRVLVALFLCAVFTIVYEIRMWNNAQRPARADRFRRN